MTKYLTNLVALQQKRTWHALHVSGREPDEMSLHPCGQHPEDAFAIQVLSQLSAHQAKCLVEVAVDVAEALNIGQAVGLEEALGSSFIGQMDKSETRPFGLDCLALLRELGDRLAAKRSTKVAQEDQEQRRFVHEGSQRLPGLRKIGVQQGCINHLTTGHAGAPWPVDQLA
jgi:hypothetical protein